MKKMAMMSLVTFAVLAFLAGQVLAGNINNGFPPGFHYTLNIHAKNESFICDYERDLSGKIIYGNVINVPDYLPNAEIRMVSGKGKLAATFTDLIVTDPCAGFPTSKDLTGNSYAMLQLPKNEYGYDVYARPLGKPSKDDLARLITIVPSLGTVEMEEYDANGNPILDSNGNPVTTDLLYLGLVTDNGFQTPSETFQRFKGKSIAKPITGLFLWSGEVCYFDTSYCTSCAEESKCCATEEVVIDGVPVIRYVYCEDPISLDPLTCDPTPHDGLLLYPVTVYCQTYNDYWVFNIADLVEYLWNVDSNVKQFNVRFYPRTQ